MSLKRNFLGLLLIFIAIPGLADTDPLNTQMQATLSQWVKQNGITGASMSISLPKSHKILDFVSGAVGSDKTQQSTPLSSINKNTLFQIGSTAKSFISVTILQLEAEGKLKITDTVGMYFPQYSRWQAITIKQLLNQSSGIVDYTDSPLFQSADTSRQWTPEQLVALTNSLHDYFPAGQGWHYSNTNYILAGMIIEKITHHTIQQELNNRFLASTSQMHLQNTYYFESHYPKAIVSRMAFPPIYNMSSAGAAGALIGNSHDLVRWARALFQGDILPPAQLKELESLVCVKTTSACTAGQTISPLKPDQTGGGYGMAVGQTAFGSSSMGTAWWHNGGVFMPKSNYSAIFIWFPQSDIALAITDQSPTGIKLTADSPIIKQIMDVLLTTTQH